MAESVTEQVAESGTKEVAVTESVTEKAAETIAEDVAEEAAETIAEKAAETIAEEVAEKAAETEEAVAKVAAETVAKEMSENVSERRPRQTMKLERPRRCSRGRAHPFLILPSIANLPMSPNNQNHNDIFSAFSNALLMNCCTGHQIRVNFSNSDELCFTLLVKSAAAVIPCCLNCAVKPI